MPFYQQSINDSEIEYMVGGWSFPVSSDQQDDWYEKVRKDKNNLRFTIALIENNAAVGMQNLVDIDWKNRSAFTGIRLFGSTPKRQGIATDAVVALMQYAFEELQLNRLDTTWVEYNTASLGLYKKCGWKVEGEKRKAVFKKGEYHSVFFGGILAEDYYEIKSRINQITSV